jgi:hypothetical protein
LPTSYADLEPDNAQDQKEGCGLLWIFSAQKARDRSLVLLAIGAGDRFLKAF